MTIASSLIGLGVTLVCMGVALQFSPWATKTDDVTTQEVVPKWNDLRIVKMTHGTYRIETYYAAPAWHAFAIEYKTLEDAQRGLAAVLKPLPTASEFFYGDGTKRFEIGSGTSDGSHR